MMDQIVNYSDILFRSRDKRFEVSESDAFMRWVLVRLNGDDTGKAISYMETFFGASKNTFLYISKYEISDDKTEREDAQLRFMMPLEYVMVSTVMSYIHAKEFYDASKVIDKEKFLDFETKSLLLENENPFFKAIKDDPKHGFLTQEGKDLSIEMLCRHIDPEVMDRIKVGETVPAYIKIKNLGKGQYR